MAIVCLITNFILFIAIDTVAWCTIAVFVAAAVIAFFCRPAAVGPVTTHLLAADLSTAPDADPSPRISVVCLDDGRVALTRHGLRDMNLSGAVSAKIEVKGFDIAISERIVPPRDILAQPATAATFFLDFLGAERYHVSYTSDTDSLFAAFTLTNRPGLRTGKAMQ